MRVDRRPARQKVVPLSGFADDFKDKRGFDTTALGYRREFGNRAWLRAGPIAILSGQRL
jgi:hypothetical protein